MDEAWTGYIEEEETVRVFGPWFVVLLLVFGPYACGGK
jgi:hypothetical protein